ncbi:MAG: homoserine dehydrogenase [Phycisphaerales bacterium]|nr:homoserine dehydrogenase [Phycisphaerales bacterium]MCB9856357.1 homoserine dehydrogenase [Phycisphaerales bacterium]MCB9864029.1 homoserine dehydrogenase [Phycisphaerales bacterium]
MVKLADEKNVTHDSDNQVFVSASFTDNRRETPTPTTIRIGLLGCGTVGGAVARQIVKANDQLVANGIRLEIVRSLVRDTAKPRRDIPPGLKLTDDANVFLAGAYDVVIEALGGLDAPRSLIQRLLARGTPVVTANKQVVAANGEAFASAAEQGGTQIRFEAAAIPGVRFLETIGRPSITGGVSEIAAVLNGTTQFVLSSIVAEGLSVDAALHRAVVLGLAEPDATRDLSGLDAADKLRLILREAGVETGEAIVPASVGVDAITPQITADAARLGGCLRQVALARIEGDCATAYVGPAWVGERHAFSRLGPLENCIALRDATGARTLYAGVGAGPDITARALLSDVVAVATSTIAAGRRSVRRIKIRANIRTPWFVYASFRRDPAKPEGIGELLGKCGVSFRRFETASAAVGASRAVGITFPLDAATVRDATKTIQEVTGGTLLAFPAIEDSTHGWASKRERLDRLEARRVDSPAKS